MSFKPDVNGPERGTLFDSPDHRYAPCQCAHEVEEHEPVFIAGNGAAYRWVCHGAADCDCTGYVEADMRDSSYDRARLGRRE